MVGCTRVSPRTPEECAGGFLEKNGHDPGIYLTTAKTMWSPKVFARPAELENPTFMGLEREGRLRALDMVTSEGFELL